MVAAVATSPVTRPPRITVTRSLTAMTSPSLWLMNTTALPSAVMARTVVNRASASWGVSTAVGSSSRSTSAPRYSTFTISTRWRWPTVRLDTRARGSTGRPNRSAIPATRSSMSARRSRAGWSGSPSTTFSATVNRSTSRKCWWTMPMPRASPSRGLRSRTGWP